MRIDPILAGLRREPAPQLHAQAVLTAVRDAWRTDEILGELDHYAAGADLVDCPSLDCALTELNRGRALVDALFAPVLETLAQHPLGHVPLRHQYSPGLAVLQLAEVGRAALSLLCYEAVPPERQRRASTVCFAGGERHELCLAGAAETRFFEVLREDSHRADLDCEPRLLRVGDAVTMAGPRRTKLVDAPQRRLVILRLSRADLQPHPAREYRIADGALVHVASGDRRESGAEMAAAVLGAMRRQDAVPVLGELVRDGSDHLRWQALRQLLTLDTGAGFAALMAIAGDLADPLAIPAGALRASLIEAHPILAQPSSPCPA
jgi:hypothetical protein